MTDAQKRANAKWKKANTKSAACVLSLEEHAAFKAYAEAHGKTISGMLLEYIRSCISTEQQPSSQETIEQQEKLEQQSDAK